MDEVNLDEFLKEASAAIDDQETLSLFFREKVTIAIERFLVRDALVIALLSFGPPPLTNSYRRTIFHECPYPSSGESLVMGGSSRVVARMGAI
jgi:hypothetical protein